MVTNRLFLPSVYTNCYLLADEDSGSLAVIDPGEDISAALLRLCADKSWSLRSVFLTHGHYDHVGGVSAVRQAFPGVSVYLHAEDSRGEDRLMPTAGLGELTLWRDGDVVSLGGLQVEVLHTPGHTRGSVCLRCRDALFTGDTLFAGSMGRTDFPGGSQEQMAASLKRLGELEENYNILPGHGEVTTLSRERKENPYLREAMGL